MTHEEFRLECVRLAVAVGAREWDVIEIAEKIERYIEHRMPDGGRIRGVPMEVA